MEFRSWNVALLLAVAASAGCEESNDASDTDAGATEGSDSDASTGAALEYDFSAVDQQLDTFVSTNPAFEGASLVLVERERGTIHQAAVGTYGLDQVVLLASTSKMPSVLTLSALAEDPAYEFDLAAPVQGYVPWESAWPDMTTEQLVSNTSGIPGLAQLDNWGLHICQASPTASLQACGEVILGNLIEGEGVELSPPGTQFSYGGSQWQLAGAVAEVVSGQEWNSLVQQYLGTPCGLKLFTYGNMVANPAGFTGNPADLIGQSNPSIEGGAIADIEDYANLLRIHLDDGKCGETQVVSPAALQAMRVDRGTALGSRDAQIGTGSTGLGYGMGWWVVPPDAGEPYLFVDPGAYGAISWIDTQRNYGGFVAIADYDTFTQNAPVSWAMVIEDLIPLIEAAIDGVDG